MLCRVLDEALEHCQARRSVVAVLVINLKIYRCFTGSHVRRVSQTR